MTRSYESPDIPRNPAFGFAWGIAWLAVGGFGIVVLYTNFPRIISGQMYGQRTEGFYLITPFVGIALGVLVLVRAILALGPWSRYAGTTPLAQRRSNRDAALRDEVVRGPLLVGLGIAAGWLVLLVVLILHWPNVTASVPSFYSALMVLVLLGIAWVSPLLLALRRLAARRRAPSMAPPSSTL